MKLQHLTVEHFRCFDHRSFEFTEHFNLIVGENGRGKTAALDAIAVAIGSWFLGFKDVPTRGIRADEARIVADQVGGKPQFFPTGDSVVAAHGLVQDEMMEWARTRKEGERSRTTTRDAARLKEISRHTAARAKEFQDVTLPLIAYYGTGRTPLQKRKKSKPMKRKVQRRNRLAAYSRCLDSMRRISSLASWFATEQWDAFENEQRSVSLESMRETILSLRTFEEARGIRYDPKYEELTVETEMGVELFGNLSDGQRAIISLVGDIAIRAMTLNPHLEAEAIRETPGVVLVDELDLHLHPEWQRQIVPDLRRSFPKIQFIATTHSAFLIQSLEPGELVNLHGPEKLMTEEKRERFGDEVYSKSSVEDILQAHMGMGLIQQSIEYEEKLKAAEAYFRAVRSPNVTEATLDALEAKYMKELEPYGDDPAFFAALRIERESERGGMR
jgi:predicted ATP-binding protein involved in virulence